MKPILAALAIAILAQDPDREEARRKRIAEALPPIRKITIEAKEAKLKDVLAELQEKSGLRLEFGDLGDAWVTVQVKDATPLEAMMSICKIAGLGCSVGTVKSTKDPPQRLIGSLPAFWFKAGDYPERPRRFDGHFMTEVTRVTLERRTRFDAPQRSARLSLQLTWPTFLKADTALLDIASVADDQGSLLFERRLLAPYHRSPWGIPGVSPNFMQTDLDMKYPAEGASSLLIKGSALILFAGEDRYITFDVSDKAVGQRKEMADMTAEFRGFKEGDVTSVTVAYKGQPKSPLPEMSRTPGGLGLARFQVRLEDGTAVQSNHTGERHDGPFRVMTLKFQGLPSKIKSVEVLAETVFHEERFDFEFKNVPLPK